MTNEQKIDLSSVTAEELAQLPGIGPALAGRIVAYRDEVRPFEEPVEITAVPGVSEKMYQAIADRLTVGESDEAEIEEIEETGEMDTTVSEPAPTEQTLVKSAPPAEPEPKAEPEAEPRTPPPPTPAHPHPRTPTPSARLGYAGLAAAILLGALFGALLALLVIGGINGTLDFGQVEAVVNNQARLDSLSVQADTLQADLDGLRQRLDDLEGLTGRMDGVEQAVDELDTTLSQTQADVDALNARADQLDRDISAVRAAANRFDTFLDGLRDLLFEFQGAPPTPTYTPTPPPTATPRPTRTPRPTATPRPTYTPLPTATPGS
ncbi:MAG: helix-hairpin-helix domain-containing protein [Chloroflexi bacterium]|nr:helix-hairpin-helix domain-containing protein [Chloroflexota bacterium]